MRFKKHDHDHDHFHLTIINMPLHVSTESPSAIAQSLESSSSKPSFLVVYASHVDGKSWCGDCRDAEPLVDAKFADRAYDVKVVYAGLKDE